MCEAIRKRGRARSYAHLLSGPCPPLSHHDRHFPSSPFHSRSPPPSLSSPVHDRAPSRRRANDLIREQWLSINNPVSPFTLPGHPPRRGGAVSVSWLPTPSSPQPRTRTLSPTSKIALATTLEILPENPASLLLLLLQESRLAPLMDLDKYAWTRLVPPFAWSFTGEIDARKRKGDVDVACQDENRLSYVFCLLKLGEGRGRSRYSLFSFFWLIISLGSFCGFAYIEEMEMAVMKW